MNLEGKYYEKPYESKWEYLIKFLSCTYLTCLLGLKQTEVFWQTFHKIQMTPYEVGFSKKFDFYEKLIQFVSLGEEYSFSVFPDKIQILWK